MSATLPCLRDLILPWDYQKNFVGKGGLVQEVELDEAEEGTLDPDESDEVELDELDESVEDELLLLPLLLDELSPLVLPSELPLLSD